MVVYFHITRLMTISMASSGLRDLLSVDIVPQSPPHHLRRFRGSLKSFFKVLESPNGFLFLVSDGEIEIQERRSCQSLTCDGVIDFGHKNRSSRYGEV